MSQLSAKRIFNAIVGLLSGLDATDESLVKTTVWRRQFRIPLADGGVANANVAEHFVWQNNLGCNARVVQFRPVAPVAVTAHGTNYATFFLYRRTSAGATQSQVCNFATDTTTTDDMVAHAPKAVTLPTGSTSNVVIPSGSVLTAELLKSNATGLAVGGATAPAAIEVVLEADIA